MHHLPAPPGSVHATTRVRGNTTQWRGPVIVCFHVTATDLLSIRVRAAAPSPPPAPPPDQEAKKQTVWLHLQPEGGVGGASAHMKVLYVRPLE